MNLLSDYFKNFKAEPHLSLTTIIDPKISKYFTTAKHLISWEKISPPKYDKKLIKCDMKKMKKLRKFIFNELGNLESFIFFLRSCKFCRLTQKHLSFCKQEWKIIFMLKNEWAKKIRIYCVKKLKKSNVKIQQKWK